MKKQLTELAEEDIKEARPVGRPKVISYWYEYDKTPVSVITYKDILKKAPQEANAFLLGRSEHSFADTWDVAVQYYQINQGDKT